MFSFDPSTTNIILTVAVVALFTFFIFLLMKLNPSTEKEEDFDTQIEVEKPTPQHTLPITPQPQNPQNQQPQRQPERIEAPRVVEKTVITVGPTVGGASVQTKQPTSQPTPTFSQNRENSRQQEKTVPSAPARTGFVTSKKDCMHHFGFLHTFPKNSPIPDECFGCEKIVDCLVSNNIKKSNGKNERSR